MPVVFGIIVKMADLFNLISRLQSPICAICCECHLKKQMVVYSLRLGMNAYFCYHHTMF